MSAEIFYYSESKRMMHFFDEIRLPNSNTFELAKELQEKYPGIKVFPDPAGTARKSSSTTSDYKILKSHGFKIRAHKSKSGQGYVHPPVKDRVNATNGMLKNADNEISLSVDPKCEHLIADFLRVV